MNKARKSSLLFAIFAIAAIFCTVFSAQAVSTPVAKVGNTSYDTMEEALSNWTAGSTLTLLADVTLTDPIKLNSTEHHILDLGAYTLNAASGKNAIEIVAKGTGRSERSTLTVQATTGGINAGSKSCIYYNYASGGITAEDRPTIYIKGGVFTSTGNGLYANGSAARKCATFNISGGTFDCKLNFPKAKLLIYGGTFNGTINAKGDVTCYRLIAGGTFKNFSSPFNFFTAGPSGSEQKLTFGSAKNVYDRGVYVNENGDLIVGGPVITDAGSQFQASAAYRGYSSYLQYSSAANQGLFYTSAAQALADNPSGNVTLYTSSLNMDGISFRGTLSIPEDLGTLTVAFSEGTVPTWNASTPAADKVVTYTDTVSNGVVTRTYVVKPAKTVTFDAQNGSAVTSVKVAENEPATAPAIPVKTGYRFDGWYTDAACTEANVWNFASTPVTTDITLYAKWTEKAVFTMTVQPQTYTWDGTSQAFSVAALGTEGSFSVKYDSNGSWVNTAPSAVGSYNVKILRGEDDTYKAYEEVFADALIIAPAIPVVTAPAAGNPVYNGEAQPLVEAGVSEHGTWEYSTDGTVYSAALPYGTDAGAYTVYARFVPSTGYARIPDVQISAVINPKTVTVKADDMVMLALDPLPELTYSVSGLVDGDVLLREPSLSSDPSYTQTVGTYPISISGAEVDSNYTLVHVNGTLTVEYSPLLSADLFGIEIDTTIINGSVVVDCVVAKTGDTVTLTVLARDGYLPTELTVTDRRGNKVGLTRKSFTRYTFRMPARGVQITASFEAINSPCTGDASCIMHAYTDLNAAAWYHDGVHFCIEHSLMVGSDDLFAPTASMSRAMAVTALWRLAGSPVTGCDIPFEDIDENAWYAEAVRWAVENGIVFGYSETEFAPNDAVTREQLATLLYRYDRSFGNASARPRKLLNAPRLNNTESVSAWAYDAIRWAVAKGIMNGYPDGSLVPKASANRAETATMLYLYCQAAN